MLAMFHTYLSDVTRC